MTPAIMLAYVQAAAELQGLALPPERAIRVAQQLERTAQLARLLDEAPLAPEDEPAELYQPLPFAPAPDRRGQP